MDGKILCLGIENEFEGHAPLWFDMREPETIINYMKDNLEENQTYEFKLGKFTEDELKEMSQN